MRGHLCARYVGPCDTNENHAAAHTLTSGSLREESVHADSWCSVNHRRWEPSSSFWLTARGDSLVASSDQVPVKLERLLTLALLSLLSLGPQ